MSRDLRGSTTPVTSPQTRTSFPTIGPVLASWVIPRETLGSPRPTHHHHHHHHSSLRRLLPLVPHPIPRTGCSHLLSALMHSGTRPRSTESSSHRIWRPYVLICVLCWPIRQLYFSSGSPSGPDRTASRLPPIATTTTAVITRGVPFTLYCSFIASEDTGYFVWGGEGGDRVSG